MGSWHKYKADPCPVCGKPDAARMGSSRWQPFDGMACSEACGLKAQAALIEVHKSAPYLAARDAANRAAFDMRNMEQAALSALDLSSLTRTGEAEPVASDGLPPGEWWMFYDEQTGRWCVYDDGPPKVIRTGADVFHVREVLSTPASDDQVEALNLAAAALAPFASAVFNDNGDLTIDASAPTSKDLAAAYFALRKVRAALLAAMGSTKPTPRLDATVRSGEEG